MLTLSTRTRYALRLLVRLASYPSGKPVRRQELAGREGIPDAYVEQILARLKTAGLVRSHRGMSGGFSLLADAETTSVHDVVVAMEGPTRLVACLEEPCERAVSCVAQTVWREAQEALVQVLRAHRIGDLARQALALSPGQPWGYEI